MRLKGERVTGLTLDEVTTPAADAADGPPSIPAIELPTIAGTALPPGALSGKIVVVEMWATWCPPCRSTMAWLNSLEAKYGDRIEVIAIAVDSAEADVRRMASDLKATYHIVEGTPEIISGFGDVAAVPKLFVFDRTGVRVQTFYGAPPDLHHRIEVTVEKVLK